jgi:hypothetical protein
MDKGIRLKNSFSLLFLFLSLSLSLSRSILFSHVPLYIRRKEHTTNLSAKNKKRHGKTNNAQKNDACQIYPFRSEREKQDEDRFIVFDVRVCVSDDTSLCAFLLELVK